MAEQAEAEPCLRDQQPYKAAVERDLRWLGAAMIKHYKGDDSDLRLLMAPSERAFQGMTVDDYAAEALGWLQTASHPTIVFGFANHGYVDGVNFHTDCARALVVSHLNRGNVHLPTSEVYLGVSKAHPRHVPFVVHRALSSA